MTGGSLHLERSPHPDFNIWESGGKKCGYLSGIQYLYFSIPVTRTTPMFLLCLAGGTSSRWHQAVTMRDHHAHLITHVCYTCQYMQIFFTYSSSIHSIYINKSFSYIFAIIVPQEFTRYFTFSAYKYTNA